MVCKTIIVDEDNILANPEVEPFFHKLKGENDLSILQSPSSGFARMSIGDRLQDALVNNGWLGKWQLVVLVTISDLKRSQKTTVPNHTERVILQKIVERIVSGLGGTFEPVRTMVIMYDSRHWEIALGKPFRAGERQRFDLDQSGYLAKNAASKVPSFTKSELFWICEPWPELPWFISYFDSISRNSVSAEHDGKIKELVGLADQVKERVCELVDEKINTLENLTQEDVSQLLYSLNNLKTDFANQLHAALEKKVGLSKDTPGEIISNLLRDVFSVKPFCESKRLLLIRFLKDSHRDNGNGLLELSFLLLVLVEYELLKFGSAYENLGWRVRVEIDPDQFGQHMASYGTRLTDCLQEFEKYSDKIGCHASFVKKVRCPEIKSRLVALGAEQLTKIPLKLVDWQHVFFEKNKEFECYIKENEKIFAAERSEIVAKPEIEDALDFHRKSLEIKEAELQNQEIEQQKLLASTPITGFHMVYNWPEKSQSVNREVMTIIETQPSLNCFWSLFLVSSVIFLLPFFSLLYKYGGAKGLIQYESVSVSFFYLLLLLLSPFLLWLAKIRRLKKIKNKTNDLIVENKTSLKRVGRKNREFLSGICTLSEISQNLEVVNRAMAEIKRDEQKMKFFSSELQEHRDLKICLKNSKRGDQGNENRFGSIKDVQPDITKNHVFFPGMDDHGFEIKKGDAAATEHRSASVPGLRRISFKRDFLFESA